MRRTLILATVLVVLTMLAAGLCSVSTASAASLAKPLRYKVIKHARTFDVVRGHHRTLVVRDHRRYVKVRGVVRYKVVRRGYRFVALRKVLTKNTVTLPAVLLGPSG